MPDNQDQLLHDITNREYEHGWSVDLDAETLDPGLTEETVRFISAKKNEPVWLLDWRLKAFRHWQKMTEPHWGLLHYPSINYQALSYYSAPKKKPELNSLDEVDPELLKTFNRLGISLQEQIS